MGKKMTDEQKVENLFGIEFDTPRKRGPWSIEFRHTMWVLVGWVIGFTMGLMFHS